MEFNKIAVRNNMNTRILPTVSVPMTYCRMLQCRTVVAADMSINLQRVGTCVSGSCEYKLAFATGGVFFSFVGSVCKQRGHFHYAVRVGRLR